MQVLIITEYLQVNLEDTSVLRTLQTLSELLRDTLKLKRLLEIQTRYCFFKGWFVTFLWFCCKQIQTPRLAESDMTLTFANKLAIKKATKVCHNFPETAKYLGAKAVHTGSPIRAELFTGDKIAALDKCGFTANKPVIMVTGGSLGAENVNRLVREALPELLPDFQIAHLCGKGKLDESLVGTSGYAQFEYISDEMKDFFAMADLIISRAGANSICEISALKKTNILIPLSARVSRRPDLNARSYAKQGFSEVLDEDVATKDDLIAMVHKVFDNKSHYIESMENQPEPSELIKL